MPSTTKRKTSRRRPAKPPVAAPTPEPVVETAADPVAEASGMFEPVLEPADQVVESSPAETPAEEPQAPDVTASTGEQVAEPAVEEGEALFDEIFGDDAEGKEEGVANLAALDAAEPAAEPPVDETDYPQSIRLGGALEALLYRVPVGVVQDLLGPDFLERVAGVRGTKASLDLHHLLRATEGRGAPSFFTAPDLDTAPVLFSGIHEIAAALDLGHEHLFVVVVPSSDAGALQTFLTSRPQPEAPETDDDLVWKVQSYYGF